VQNDALNSARAAAGQGPLPSGGGPAGQGAGFGRFVYPAGGGPQQVINFYQQQVRAATAVEQELEKVRMKTRQVAEAYVSAGQKGGAELDELIGREKTLQNALKESEALIRRARGGGPKPPVPASFGQRVVAGADAGLDALGAATSALGKAAIPVAVVAFAAQAAEGFSSAFRGLAVDLTQSRERAAKEGFLTPYANRVGSGQAEGLSMLANSDNSLLRALGRGGLSMYAAGPAALINPALGNPNAGKTADLIAFASGLTESMKKAAEEEKKRFSLIEEEIRLRQEAVSFSEQLNQREKGAAEKELQLVEERVRTAQAIVDQEQEQLNRSKEAFGLLDAREKQDFRAIAEKVAAGGIDSLSKEEAKFARQNPAIADLFSEAAGRSADANGFAKIADLLGADKKLAEAKEKLSIELDQQAEFTV
jgi:hypothetical protein